MIPQETGEITMSKTCTKGKSSNSIQDHTVFLIHSRSFEICSFKQTPISWQFEIRKYNVATTDLTPKPLQKTPNPTANVRNLREN